MSKHTPGPWEISHRPAAKDIDERIGVVSSANKACIVYRTGPSFHINGAPKSDSLANARLIAAAPELLDVLQKVQPYYLNFPSALQDELRAVIAKATDQTAKTDE